MVSLTVLFGMFVVLFAIIGAMRGWAKELLVTSALVLGKHSGRHAFRVQLVNDKPVKSFDSRLPGVQRLHVLDLAGLEVFSLDIQRFGFQSQVDVLRNQDHRAFRVLFLHHHRSVQNSVVGLVSVEYVPGVQALWRFIHDHLEESRVGPVDLYPVGRFAVGRKPVHDPDEFPGLEILGIIAFFEIIKFFQHRDRDRDVVIFETVNCIMIIKK